MRKIGGFSDINFLLKNWDCDFIPTLFLKPFSSLKSLLLGEPFYVLFSSFGYFFRHEYFDHFTLLPILIDFGVIDVVLRL